MFLIIFDVLQIIGLTLTAYIGYKAFKEYYRQNSPEVYITIYSDKRGINIKHLKVKNVGKSVAYNITFEVKEDFEIKNIQGETIKFSEIGFIKYGIPQLGPNDEIATYLLTAGKSHYTSEELYNIRSKIIIHYYDVNGKKYISPELIIDFKEFLNTRQPGGDLYAERLQKIEEEIHNLSNIIQGKMVIKSSKVDILEKTSFRSDYKKYEPIIKD